MTYSDDEIFQECLQNYQSGNRAFWHTLAEKFEYSSPEALRSWFRREMDRRDIPTKTNASIDPERTAPKILLLDIETAPLQTLVWSPRQRWISRDAMLKDWFILCYGAKWLCNGEAFGKSIGSKESLVQDDKVLLEELWKTMNEADIVLAYNGRQFDIPRINTRFLYHGILPLPDRRIIDPMETIRSTFSMTYNKLDYVLEYLGLPQKRKTNFDLWKRCLSGDQTALDDMLKYCVNDADVLEALYMRLRPWMKRHPNLSAYVEGSGKKCPICLSPRITKIDRPYRTTMGNYQQFRCGECGAVGRLGKNLLDKWAREPMLRPVEQQ